MGKIRTVTGDIDAAEIGITSVHEHTVLSAAALASILVRSVPGMVAGIRAVDGGRDVKREAERRLSCGYDIPRQSMTGLLGSFFLPRKNPASRLSDAAYYTNELKAFAAIGGKTVCDCSPINMGFSAPSSMLQQTTKDSGVRIVSCVGYYVRPSIRKADLQKGERYMTDSLIRYMEDGDGKSDARPGFVKCAIAYLKNGEVCPEEQAAVRVCAGIAKRYGTSLHIHTAFPLRSEHVLRVADKLRHKSGIDPGKVIFCHTDGMCLGDSNPAAQVNASGYDSRHAKALLQMGYNIGMDTWSVGGALDDSNFSVLARYKMLSELLADGYAEQITLGHDFMAKTRGVQNGGGGYVFCTNYLKEKAKTDPLLREHLHTLLIDNPARILSIDG